MAKKKPAPSNPAEKATAAPPVPAPANGPAAPAAKEPEPAPLADDTGRWSVHLRPLFRRNPDAPVLYAPFVDVRNTPHGVHLLLFQPPAADPEEIIEKDGEKRLPVSSMAEIILPPDAVEPLILGLAQQYRSFLVQRIQEEAAREGIEITSDLRLEWIDHILGLQRTEEQQ